MDFQGFHSIEEYERVCARLGFSTQRIPFHNKGDENFFVLITGAPSRIGVRSWHLFPSDGREAILDGIISDTVESRRWSVIDGVDVNWLGKLSEHGYFPDEDGKETA